MEQRLRVGLLGCGRIAGLVHLPVLAALPAVEVTAIAESDPERMTAAARLVPHAARFGDYGELLDRAGIDAAIVTLPTHLHVSAAARAFARGLHVYLEKPLATSLDETAEILEAWRAAGTVGMIGYNCRFNPRYQEARSLLELGRIGDVVSVQSAFCTASRELPVWRVRREIGGGALLDLASHHVDLAPWLFARPVRRVACLLQSRQSEDDTVALQLELDGGPPVQILAAFASVEQERLEITGQEGRLVVDCHGSSTVELHGPSLDRVRLRRLAAASAALASPVYWKRKARGRGPEDSYWRALSHFARSAREGTAASPDLDDGYRCLAVIEAAEQSARSRTMTEVSAERDERPAR